MHSKAIPFPVPNVLGNTVTRVLGIVTINGEMTAGIARPSTVRVELEGGVAIVVRATGDGSLDVAYEG